MADSPLLLAPSVDRLVAKAERAARSINDSRDLAGIARFLLRSEAIASSRIEGVTPSASQVVLAELEAEADEGLLGTSEQAQLVARNMTIVRSARTELADTDVIRSEHLEAPQSALLENDPDLSGCRRKQNWIGGSSYHPIDADFIPPSPERVPAFIDDLVAYMNGAAHSPIVQAALVHAQLETIHPFADGNGRVGALSSTRCSRGEG